MGEIQIREAGLGFVAEASGSSGGSRDFSVNLLRTGLSKNGRYFTREAVSQLSTLGEGARVFADHPTPAEDRERPVRSVRGLVGYITTPTVVQEAEGGELVASGRLHLFESAEWLACLIRESLAEGVEVCGLSIDSVATVQPGTVPGDPTRRVPVVSRFLDLRSVDVVTRPSAGGGFLSVQEAELMDEIEGGQSGTGENEGGAGGAGGAAGAAGAGGGTATAVRESAAPAGVTGEAVREAEALLAEVRAERVRAAQADALDAALAAAPNLPAAVAVTVRRLVAPDPSRWATAEIYREAVDGAIEDAGALVAELERSRPAPERIIVTGNGVVRVTVSEADKQRAIAQLGMDRLFGLGVDEADPDVAAAKAMGLLPMVPRWMGIREAYTQLTGDPMVTGTVNAEGSIVREANEVTTGVLNLALLNSMTKRLIADYKGQPQDWRKFCTVTPLQNFKSQDRVQLHDFASLSTVAEGAAYANLAWDDRRESYSPAKRGNLVVVTREAVLNDDLNAIRRIPSKLARAAHITINEFVYGLFTGNPLMSDGTKIFDDGVQTSHGNRGTTALSDAALKAILVSMLKQTDTAGKRLNLRPKYLLVPADLYYTAQALVLSERIVGSANNDANLLKGLLEPIPVAQFTDVTDYYLLCDPLDVESIEIGFVGGREEPEFLLQDGQLLGQVFTNDQISYKVRWEFGGAWLDFRGAFWANVAG